MSFRAVVILADGSERRKLYAKKPTMNTIEEVIGGPAMRIVGFTKYKAYKNGEAYYRADSIHQGLPINSVALKAWREQIPGFNLRGPVMLIFPGAQNGK